MQELLHGVHGLHGPQPPASFSERQTKRMLTNDRDAMLRFVIAMFVNISDLEGER